MFSLFYKQDFNVFDAVEQRRWQSFHFTSPCATQRISHQNIINGTTQIKISSKLKWKNMQEKNSSFLVLFYAFWYLI